MVNMFRQTAASTDAAQTIDRAHSIVSDPLAQLACLFAALIHGVDHPGVPNVKVNQDMASGQKSKSIAEQNSAAWTAPGIFSVLQLGFR